jgi:hypothetical protein
MTGGGVLLNRTLKALRIRNSSIEDLTFNLELLPDKEVPEIIRLMADLMFMLLSMNLHWFLQNQITLKILTTADRITRLQRGEY